MSLTEDEKKDGETVAEYIFPMGKYPRWVYIIYGARWFTHKPGYDYGCWEGGGGLGEYKTLQEAKDYLKERVERQLIDYISDTEKYLIEAKKVLSDVVKFDWMERYRVDGTKKSILAEVEKERKERRKNGR